MHKMIESRQHLLSEAGTTFNDSPNSTDKCIYESILEIEQKGQYFN